MRYAVVIDNAGVGRLPADGLRVPASSPVAESVKA